MVALNKHFEQVSFVCIRVRVCMIVVVFVAKKKIAKEKKRETEILKKMNRK